MAALFNRLGISFQYPENWSIEEEKTSDNLVTVSAHSPTGAFWSIAIHPIAVDPQEMAEAVVGVMSQEYEQLDSTPVSEHIAAFEADGFDMNFYCLDLTSTAKVGCFQDEDYTYVLFWQYEDRDETEVEPVFHAISASLTLNPRAVQ